MAVSAIFCQTMADIGQTGHLEGRRPRDLGQTEGTIAGTSTGVLGSWVLRFLDIYHHLSVHMYIWVMVDDSHLVFENFEHKILGYQRSSPTYG